MHMHRPLAEPAQEREGCLVVPRADAVGVHEDVRVEGDHA